MVNDIMPLEKERISFDVTGIKIRCSSLGKIMTDPKAKTIIHYFHFDKEIKYPTFEKLILAEKFEGLRTEKETIEPKENEMSETAKTYIEELFLLKNYGYREIVQTDEMKKGNLCEMDSIKLCNEVLKGDFRTRHKKNIQNDYITGTPDIVLSDCVEDIKTSWNLRTFFNAEPSKDYTAQGQGYMELTGCKKFRLIYCLVPTPSEIMFSLEKKLFYQYENHDQNSDYLEALEQLHKNNDLILDIPIEKRVKVFEYNYDGEYIKDAYRRIERAREYYSTLTL